MKCEIAHDLITLYAENLCSPETATELEAHLATCEVCSKKLANYKNDITEKLTASGQDICEPHNTLKPMKKVRKKLAHRKWLSIILALVILIMLWGIGYLSYGQVTNNSMSFSSLVDIYKLNKVTKAYAEGDSQPLIDILSFPFAEIYALEATTDYESFDDYKAYLQEKLNVLYEKDLKDKKLTIELNTIYWGPYEEMYSIDSPLTAYCYDFYDENGNWVLSIDFNKMGANKYTLSEYSTYSEIPNNTFSREFVNYLLPNENVTTNILLPYAARNTYEAIKSGDTTANPGKHFSTIIRYYDPDTDAENAGSYKIKLEEKITALYEEGICFTDVLYAVDTFDTDTGYWIYKVMFQAKNLENDESCALQCYFRYYNYRLFVIPEETSELIGADALTEEQVKQLITLFDS